jgi:HK97 family phage prohead protease
MRKYFQITNKSLEEFGVLTHEELWKKISEEYDGMSCEIPVAFEKTVTKKDDKEEETYIMVASDDKEDRHGDIVMQNWIIAKNIPLLDSHNYSSIVHIIGTFSKSGVDKNKLKGELKFSKANPKGQLAKEMVDEGTIVYSSVGFIPKEFDDKGRIMLSELLELSLVSVPANPRASLEKKEITKEFSEDEEIEETPVIEEEVQEINTEIKLDRKKVLLASIKKSVDGLEARNIQQKKREIFKVLRSLSK